MIRAGVIFFCVGMMLVLWALPNSMDMTKRMILTLWVSLLGAIGLFELHRMKGQMIRQHRRDTGCCHECGYDLRVQLALSERSESNERGTPDQCPECGASRTFVN